MTLERDDQFLMRLLAPIREVCERPLTTLGIHGEQAPHGTTIGAFIVEKGQFAIAFSDGKVSMGNTPVSMTYRKMFTIDRYSRLLISGSPVLGMMYASAMRSWFGYLQDVSDQNITARANVKALSKTLFRGLNMMGAGIVCAPIFATYDIQGKKCARIFKMGGEGSEVEYNDLAVAGSGGGIDGLLRDHYNRIGGTAGNVDAGIELARTAVKLMAPAADSFSGGKVSIDLIGPDGVRTIE